MKISLWDYITIIGLLIIFFGEKYNVKTIYITSICIYLIYYVYRSYKSWIDILLKSTKKFYDNLLAKWYFDDVIFYFDRFNRYLFDDIFIEIRDDIYKEILEKDRHNTIDISSNMDQLRIRYNKFIKKYLKIKDIRKLKIDNKLFKEIIEFNQILQCYNENIIGFTDWIVNFNHQDKICINKKDRYNKFRQDYILYMNSYGNFIEKISRNIANTNKKDYEFIIEKKTFPITFRAPIDIMIEVNQLNKKLMEIERNVLILDCQIRLEILTGLIKNVTIIVSELNQLNVSDRHSSSKIIYKIENSINFLKNNKELMEKIRVIIKYSKMNYEDIRKLDEFKGYNHEDVKKRINDIWLGDLKKDLDDELKNIYYERDKLIEKI